MSPTHRVAPVALLRRSLADLAPVDQLVKACANRDLAAVRELAARAELREAVEVASPSLGEQLDRFLAGDTDEKRTRRTVDALLRYAVRMRNRATPMGLFAGVGVVALDAEEGVSASSVTRVVRPSAAWCAGLAAELAEQDEVLLGLRVTASRAVYVRRREIVVLGSEADRSGYAVTTHLPLTRAILDRCAEWRPTRDVVAFTEEFSGAAPAAASRFVLDLIRHGLLVSELAEVGLSVDPFGALERLVVTPAGDVAWPGWAAMRRGLTELRRLVDRLPATETVPVSEYRKLRRTMTVLHETADLHVDAVVAGPAPEPPDTGRVYEACRALIAAQHPAEPPEITAAVRWFTDRYSDTHTVRLAEMFLPGKGFDLAEAARPSRPEPDSPSGFAVDVHRLLDAPVEVDLLSVLDRARRRAAELPDTFVAVVQSAPVTGHPVRLRSLSGGLGLVGRFAHLDPAIGRFARDIVRAQEEREDFLRVEVRCPCAERSRNVAVRPMLRHACVDFGPPAAGRDQLGRQVISLPVADILVRVVDGRLHLYSERLGRRIVPSVASALLHRFCLYPAGAFLTLLAGHETRAREWSWHELDRLRALPRVVAGSVLLAPRQWLVAKDDLDALRSRVTARSAALDELAATKLVTVGPADSPLLVDLDSPGGFAELERQVRRAGHSVKVYEAAAPAFDRVATELVIPYFADAAPTQPATVVAGRPGAPSFGPGSRWASLKVYGRPPQLAALLPRVLPLIDSARSAGTVRRWFFLRYADPQHHLRLRFTGRPDRLWGEFVPALWRELHVDNLLWDTVVADEYRPEIDRYGGPRALPLAEALFGAESDLVAQLGSLDDTQRLLVSALTMHRLLTALRFTGEPRRRLVADAERSRAMAHDLESARVEAGRRYRASAGELDRWLWSGHPVPEINEWTSRLDALAPRLRHALDDDPDRVAAVMRSLLHMQCNRMFPEETNFWEVVACSTLRRAYDRASVRPPAVGGRRHDSGHRIVVSGSRSPIERKDTIRAIDNS